MGNYHVRFGGRERRVLIEARPSRPNAELGAAFVSGAIGIKLHDREDHAAYLSSWLQALRNDKRCIFTAARQAQEAADWLLCHMGAQQAAALEKAA